MGGATADALLKLGYPVSAWTRTPRQHRPGLRCYSGTEQLQEFASQVDVLVCLLPLTDATRWAGPGPAEQVPRWGTPAGTAGAAWPGCPGRGPPPFLFPSSTLVPPGGRPPPARVVSPPFETLARLPAVRCAAQRTTPPPVHAHRCPPRIPNLHIPLTHTPPHLTTLLRINAAVSWMPGCLAGCLGARA